MEFLAAGRDCAVYALDGDRVLRRNLHGADTTVEAELMRTLHAQGFPVPEVFDAEGGDIVMRRLHGPTLAAAMLKESETYRFTLGELHRRLHELTAPSWLAGQWRGVELGQPRAILHLDLHPLNVLVTEDGPVVIDWSNAAAGDAEVDVAMSFVILVSSPEGDNSTDLRALKSRASRDLYQAFSAIGDAALDLVLRLRENDPNLTAAERRQLRGSVNAAVAAVRK